MDLSIVRLYLKIKKLLIFLTHKIGRKADNEYWKRKIEILPYA